MKAIRIAVTVIVVLALGGCSIFINVFGGPQVTLTATKTVLSSGEIVSLDATVSNPSGLLQYKWYEDGVDLAVSTSEYSYSKFVTSSADIAITVEVTDTQGRKSTDSVVLTVVRPITSATIHIVNNSSYDIYYLYISPASSGDWGPDQLRPSFKIYSLGSWDVSGIPTGSWDLRAVSIYSTYTWTLSNEPVVAPGTYTWTLTNANMDL